MLRRIVDSAAAMAVSVEVLLMPGTGGVDVIEESLSFREVSPALRGDDLVEIEHGTQREAGVRPREEEDRGCCHAEPDGRRGGEHAGLHHERDERRRGQVPATEAEHGARPEHVAERRPGASAIATRARRPTATVSTASTPRSGTTTTAADVGGQHPHVDERDRDHRDDDRADDERPPPGVAESRPEGADRAEPALGVLAEGAERGRDAGCAQRARRAPAAATRASGRS